MKKAICTVILISLVCAIFSEMIYLKDGNVIAGKEGSTVVGIRKDTVYVNDVNNRVIIVNKSEIRNITNALGDDKTPELLNKADFLDTIALDAMTFETMTDRQFQVYLQKQQNAKLSAITFSIWGTLVLSVIGSFVISNNIE